MSTSITIGSLRFEFDDDWKPLCQWDEHPAYKNGLRHSSGDKAVDIVGIRSDCLYFIEVKDYRVSVRQKESQHLEEFEKKVVGTVAGLVGAHRGEQYPDLCKPVVATMTTPSRRMVVVYWVELPETERIPDVTRRQRRKSRSSIRTQEGKGRLHWLRARYLLADKAEQDENEVIPGLRVFHQPGSGRPPAVPAGTPS
ncbi:MAG: hypothetical protein JXB05_30525 [Myxococcaceae bacterium]|nr:hypothetical protein [Myxococcaceae bacterium]